MRQSIRTVTPESESADIIGWVHEIRDLGGLTFFLIRDRTGIIQVTIPKKKVPEGVVEVARNISRESVVRVQGKVKAIEKAPGGREIVPEVLEVISVAESPLPLDVAEKVPAELDTRIDSRFLDARKPRVRAIFCIRSAATCAATGFLHSRGYINITTPKIVAAATEGGTDLFPIAYFEKEAFMNQSPQLYKQMMMAAGFEKVFEIGPIFRAEEHNTVRHLNEATSLDVEVSFADHNDVMELLEDLIVHVYDHVAKTCGEHLADLGVDLAVPKKPFPRISYAEAIEIANRTIEEKLAFGDDLSPAAERAIGNEIGQHYFIVDWPTEIRPYYAMPYPDRPEICKAFDLMHPRMELSSGAQRIHDHDLLVERIRAKGLSPEAFEFYLRAFRYGMPPHAGWGLGIERLVMTMLDLGNIREAVLFPRDRHRLTP
ncbi:MAG TPA: aspartate--tRNA(Asn) ligase [Candidatus Methanoculleus thermohydrogenotrophicum]|jgi:aspartyl-tRNA synthetase|nr:aspartate--tRNA(Asn) ligase [Candidatus Methanoculleus thermohydrogenotrophicum]NLM82384.1 aspartate--tRNA(Asn) ligase [Candidatus Methanoculleus thermohydrogenotrophicum]HOB18867.1 aspartate--tRNA(Asn) ligase [Candidatus Methanoculleus thermohydrogenotrophicum]HPZ38627.1 aspartate--tRNA(Asn) ligase [Candidatus Methanoculleus thermohydrogenotrophicum]HQC91776.1 aspartate--tRNA(Asn) ligase [Candidatus Methanoculleus thermohydrogenotrophicum]